jgi:PAS domain S-box-containing protein
VSATKKIGRVARSTPAVTPALLAAALRAQSEGVFIAERRLDQKGFRIIFVNDGFCALTGRAARDLIGCAHGELHDEPLDTAQWRAWLKRALPGQSFVGEGFLRRADGTTISTAWSFNLVTEADGQAAYVVATYRDQTEKRRLQEALVHAQRLDAVGRLAGGVAHDFNNQLSVINGYCELLVAHMAANPQALREVAEIHAAGRKAAALTQQLLAFSRRQPFDLRVISLNALVRENAEILARLLGDAGTLDFELAPDLANVRTDPAQLQQAILNLVLNARDALRDRGRVTITTANRNVRGALHRRVTDAPPGRYVSLSVIDNGTGMDAETQKHLFEPFFTTKPEGKGTGLGLALVYGVVQQSGGFVTVKSSLFVGSTFEILLPAERAPVELPAAAPAVPALPVTRGTETVLIAERDELVRKMVAGILAADGYRVFAGKTLAAAQLEAAGRAPRLVITELTPLDEKTVRELLATQPELRVLRATNQPDAGPLSGLAPERQQAIAKPYALSEVLKTVRRLLDA